MLGRAVELAIEEPGLAVDDGPQAAATRPVTANAARPARAPIRNGDLWVMSKLLGVLLMIVAHVA